MASTRRVRDAVAVLVEQRRQIGWSGAFAERVVSILRRAPSYTADRRGGAEVERPDPAATASPTDDAGGLVACVDGVRREVGAVDERVRRLETGALAVHRALVDLLYWSQAPVLVRRLVSVVMPVGSPARRELLLGAIESLRNQSYRSWELVVVDDAPEPFVEGSGLATIDDRIRVVRPPERGQRAAREAGRHVASGEIVAYLDDDCRMFPWWLQTLAAVFDVHDGVDVVVGDRIVEPGDGAPFVLGEPFDPRTLHLFNLADSNVLAHRRDAPFTWRSADADDATARSCLDYEAILRAAGASCLHVSVPAVVYGTRAPDRIGTDARSGQADRVGELRRRARSVRPLRVLAHNDRFPLTSETYIGDELEALRANGIELAMSRHSTSRWTPDLVPDAPLYESLVEGLERHEPDLVLFHWATAAAHWRGEVVGRGVPYGVRSHSFDHLAIGAALDDPWCIGVWGFGHEAVVGDRVTRLPTLVRSVEPIGPEHRPASVVSISAALPKRSYDRMFVDALVQHATGVPTTIALAGTEGFEHVVDDVRRAAAGAPWIDVRTEVPYGEVQRLLRRSAVLVYALDDGVGVGEPRSVVEGGLAGCTLVLPDVPALVDMVDGRCYRYAPGKADSLGGAVAAALAGPLPWDERRGLAARLAARHADPSIGATWADDLHERSVRWWRDARRDHDASLARWWRGQPLAHDAEIRAARSTV